MNKSEVFEVVVRSIGLIVFLRGMASLSWAALIKAGAPDRYRKRFPLRYRFLWAAGYLVIGVLLMGWAEGIAKMFDV